MGPRKRAGHVGILKRGLSRVRIRARPGNRAQGWLTAQGLTIPAALGWSGVAANKREGDGATPRGAFHPLRLWWRPDRGPVPSTRLPLRRIGPNDAWSEDPRDRRYNRPVKRKTGESGDRLARRDDLYDLIVEIDHNTRPRIAGRGSAVFIHLARPGFAPTAGCVALQGKRLRWLVGRLSKQTIIDIA